MLELKAQRQRAFAGRVAVVVAGLRILTSYPWLNSALFGSSAKMNPNFLSGAGLTTAINHTFIHTAINRQVVDLLTHFVLPNATLFAWLIALGQLAVGILVVARIVYAPWWIILCYPGCR